VRRLTEQPTRAGRPGSGERDVVVDGVRWRSRESPGNRGSPPVVYVHGFLSSSSTWKRVLSQASAGRAAIAVDLPGAGFSDRPWPYDYTVFGSAQHLLRYLEVRGLSRVVLVGSSLGAAVCEVAAAIRPERVQGLVAVDGASPVMRIPIGFRLLRTPLVGEVQMELLARPVMEYTLRHRLYAQSDRVTDETVDDWWIPVTVPGTRRAALETVRTNPRAGAGLLEKIRAPTLVLWGEEDALLPPSQGRALASAIAGARFVALPSVGHLPQEEAPEEFARLVSRFLRELDAAHSP
jgi:pimeloyl-ACP methyl ester carboxylesterase